MTKFYILALLVPFQLIAVESVAPCSKQATNEVRSAALPKSAVFKSKVLYDHVAYLASDETEGRLAGSPGQAKAREFIVKQLRKSGLTDIRRQSFDFISDVKLGPKTALTAHFAKAETQGNWFRAPQNGVSQYKPEDDFRPMRISKSGEITEPVGLVFAGYGISAPEKGYDDYKDLDVKGKVVLVLRTEPETADGKKVGIDKPDVHHAGVATFYSDFYYKAAIARDKGAVALVIVNGRRGVSDSERATLESFQRGGGRTDGGIPFIQIFPEVADDWLRPAGKNITDLQKAIDAEIKPASFVVPGVTISGTVDVIRQRATDENVCAVIPGTDPVLRNEIIVIGAHYDHLGRGNEFSLADAKDIGKIHYGADDNASGCASLLEIAAALRRNRDFLKRTVWIVFWGAEELGTIGSNYFTKTPPPGFDMKNVSAKLNMDMVGRCRDNKVMVYGVGTGVGFDEVLKNANRQTELQIKPSQDGFGASDQTAFVNAGVPVLFFNTGSHSDYHKPSDTLGTLNITDQARITALVYNTAAEVINAPARPAFVKIEAPKMGGGMGGVGLGTLPDYAFEGKGMRISGVRGNSAADKSGLKAGDIIVNMGGKNIETIHDYMYALRESRAGMETSLTITRDGKSMDVKVVPEKR